MGRYANVTKEFDQELRDVVDDLTVMLPLSDLEIRKAFTDDEAKEIQKWLVEVRAAKSENEKLAKLMETGTAAGKKALALMRKLGVGV